MVWNHLQKDHMSVFLSYLWEFRSAVFMSTRIRSQWKNLFNVSNHYINEVIHPYGVFMFTFMDIFMINRLDSACIKKDLEGYLAPLWLYEVSACCKFICHRSGAFKVGTSKLGYRWEHNYFHQSEVFNFRWHIDDNLLYQIYLRLLEELLQETTKQNYSMAAMCCLNNTP